MSWQQSLISTSVSKVDLKPELQYVPPFVQSILQKLLSLPCGSLTVKTNWFISTRRKKRKNSRKKKAICCWISAIICMCANNGEAQIFSLSIYYPLSCQERKLQEGNIHLNISGEKNTLFWEKKTKSICLRTHLARENEDCSYSHKVKLNNSQQVRPRAIQHIVIFQMAGTGP